MGRRLFDFQCPGGHTHEALVDSEIRVSPCPTCGKEATRLIGTPRVTLDGCSGDFPSAADAWEKRRESHMKWERRNMDRHGTPR